MRPERARQKNVGKNCQSGLPFQGKEILGRFSEGVALGYNVPGRWPEKPFRRLPAKKVRNLF
jgi:hypothetical protein